MKNVKLITLFVLVFNISPAFAGTVDEAFKPYVKVIKRDIKTFCSKDEFQHKNFRILFSTLPGHEVGLCVRNHSGFRIFIDPLSWETMGVASRYEVLAHEMSHCMLHLDHTADKQSYMNPYLRKSFSINETRLQMISEIGKVCSENPAHTWNTRAVKAYGPKLSKRSYGKRSRQRRKTHRFFK